MHDLEVGKVMDSLTIIVISPRTLLSMCNMEGVECAWASCMTVGKSHRRNQLESLFAANGSEVSRWGPYEDYSYAMQDEHSLNARQISQCNVS